MHILHIGRLVLLLTVVTLFIPHVADAQSWRGVVRGIVVDQSGARVAGATIVVTNESTSAAREVLSSDAGEYLVPAVAPGRYRIEARVAGHKTWRRDVELLVNQERHIDVQLEVGDVSEVVQVSAPAVGRGDAAPLGTTIDAMQVRALPLDGRNVLELSLLAPGTAPAPQGSASSVRGDFAFSANGAREDFNSYLLDGADNTDPKLNTVAVRPAVDAIQEFEVLTSGYDAAFGRYAGAQVNVVTRSGSNLINGTAYGFFRNGSLDAKNAFAPEDEPAPEYQRQQVGGSIGGPIRRGRTFFFADYEGTRRREGITRVTTVPTLAERQGDFSQSAVVPRDPRSGQALPFIPGFFQHPIGRALANLYPSPNRASPLANYVSSPIETDDTHQFDVRFDHAVSQGGALTARYSFSDRQLFEPFSGPGFSAVPGFGNDAPRRAQNIVVNDARVVSSAWLNDARVSFTRVANAVTQEGQGTSLNRQLGLPELSSDPRDWGLSFISVLGYSPLGHEYNNPQEGRTRVLQLSDTLTWSRGAHLVKLGGEARFIAQDAFRDVQSRGQLTFTGQITGNPVADLLLGAPVLTVAARLDNPQRLRTETMALFAQDSWRLRENLTVSAGVRYERFSPPVDPEDRANVFDPSAGSLVQVGTNGVPRAGFATDTNNFAPRLGVSWTPTASGTTLVRGSYGMYYSQSALAPGEALYFSPPYYNLSFYFPLPDGSFAPTLSDPFPATFPLPTPPSALAFQRDLATPFLHHWNVAVQQQIGGSWSVEAAYVASRGRNLLAARDMNQAAPSPRPLNLRPNPFFSDIMLLESRGRSEYDAFMLTTERRISGGLSLLASYTLSSTDDDASGFFSSAGDPNFPQDSHNPAAEWGRSSFDIRHRVAAGVVYDLPFRGSVWSRDWQVSGIATLQSGRPFTVALLPDLDNSNTGRASLGFGFNDRPNVSGEASVSDPSAARWFNTGAFSMPAFGTFGTTGRNTLDGPGYANVNVAVIKLVPLGADTRLQLRLEAFNLFNRTNYNLPDAFFGSPTFGQILSAQAPRRIQLGARVLF
jgi:hypothetical protein